MKQKRSIHGDKVRNPQWGSRDEERLLGRIAADFARNDARYAHEEGRLHWSTVRNESADPKFALKAREAVQLRQGLLESSPRVPLPLNDEMRAIVDSLGRRLPVDGDAEAGWVRAGSGPQDYKLLVRVPLADPANLPTGRADVWFTSDLPLDSDLSRLGPADLDSRIFVHENLGGNQEAMVFSLRPELIAAAA